MIKSNSKSKNAPTMIRRTAANKIRHIEKQIVISAGKHLSNLQSRLEFWKSKL